MRKKVQYQLATVLLFIASIIGLVVMEQPQISTSKNALRTWTNGSLKKDTWVEYTKQQFVLGNPMEKDDGVKYWVIESNSTSILAVSSKETVAGPLGGEAREIDLFIYNANNTWFAFPFTIHIPKATSYFAQNESFTILAHKQRFDTIYFKFKIMRSNKKIIQEWLLDEDTHLAKRIKVQKHYLNSIQPSQGYIMEATKSSVFLGNEVQLTANILGFVSLIAAPIIGATLLYKRQSRSLKKEKQRLQSEEYRKQYFEEHVDQKYQKYQ